METKNFTYPEKIKGTCKVFTIKRIQLHVKKTHTLVSQKSFISKNIAMDKYSHFFIKINSKLKNNFKMKSYLYVKNQIKIIYKEK